jgi:hypothetical protein
MTLISCSHVAFHLVVYVSSEKLRRIAVSILLFPSVCFTITQLHSNSFIHNVSGVDVRCVLEHLVQCELLEYVQRGLKTSRRSTSVYVKKLPLSGFDSEIDNEHVALFGEKLIEFDELHHELTIQEYLKQSSAVVLDASGTVTEELLAILSLPEYASIDMSSLHYPTKRGRICYCTIGVS